MLPQDWKGGDDPGEAKAYLAELKLWTDGNAALVRAQQDARNALDAADARIGVLTGWLTALQGAGGPLSTRTGSYLSCLADLARTTAEIAHDDALITDLRAAYAVGTARLLGDVPRTTPLVLLPLRIETHWTPTELLVRIFPDEIGVDSHDERLTPTEQQAGARYWAGVGDDPQTLQSWEELVRQTGAARAGWVAGSTRPGQPAPATRSSGWETVVSAGLLPDRFAVIAVADQVFRPLRLGAAGPRVTWGAPIPDPLTYDVFAPADPGTWLTDFSKAEAVGMAVRIPYDTGADPIETLLVVGVRDDQSPDLAGLLSGHGFTGGLEVLADGAPTNNSQDLRAALDPGTQSAAARSLLLDAPTLPPGAAGEELSTLLGVPADTFGGVLGADFPRGPAADAMAELVGAGTAGALRDTLGEGAAAWPEVRPIGSAATLRIGRQPYGVLPVTAPARWLPQPGERTAGLTDVLRRWGEAVGSPLDVDPLVPPNAPTGGVARSVTPSAAEAMASVMVESPASISWQGPDRAYVGLDDLVGPATGPTSPAVYLEQIAATDAAGLAALRAGLPPLLAQVAVAAKQGAGVATIGALNSALSTLAGTLDADDPEPGRAALSRLLASTVDAASHRFDAWVTGATTERLLALRSASPGTTTVGAFGWLTDLRPAEAARSAGHVLAPSLAHAATAAVLRAGYLSEVETAGRSDGSRQPMAVDLSSRRVRTAASTLAAIRAGQPLAAVLGRQLEDDLVTSGLQRYLATFRKLTRFRTGSQLEGLEDARRAAQQTLARDRQHLEELQSTADLSRPVAAAAATALTQAQQAQTFAEAAAAPFVAMQTRAAFLRDSEIDRLAKALAAVDADKPVAAQHVHKIKVPVP